VNSWPFRPDITPSNIRVKLPENLIDILLSGRNDGSIISLGMSTVRRTIGVLTAAVALSCCAETNDLERAIASFPKINAWNYRPDLAAQSANILIQAGEDAACHALESSVRTRRERRKAYVGFDDELFAQEDAINRNVSTLRDGRR